MTVATRLFTSKDLDRFPALPGVRYEIIDGKLYVSRATQFGHGYACASVASAIHTWSEETGAGFAGIDPGLVFAEDQDVIPDLVWVSRALYAVAIDENGHFTRAPEIVVEVLSPGRANEVRDREIKLGLYARRGVREYWIVDWQQRFVEIFRRAGDQLVRAATLSGEDEITSPILPGFHYAVARMWLPDRP